MEPVIVKCLGRKYVFHPGEIIIMKKDKVIRVIRHDEIKEITYNPEFGFRDFLQILFIPTLQYSKKSFYIAMKSKKIDDDICIGLSSSDFEKVKATFEIPIELV